MIILKELFIKQITESLDANTEALIGGAGENYSEIQSIRGEIRGLQSALETFNDIWNKLVNTENGLEEE
jgi:hypothetical protein